MTPPPREVELPEGWLPHDGGPCPVDPESKPAVLFRDGFKQPVGEVEARAWSFPVDDENLWGWTRKGPADIIAYKPEPTP